ncbi:MAG: universal stress protein [Proteobacteria bacterium]|nr:universal stress protein [Pseudomonadota bacterium]
MYKKVLVPVDGSETAERGLQEAIRLAVDQGARIRIVHVVDEFVMVSPYAVVTENVIEGLCISGKSVLASALETVQRAGVAADTQLIEAFGTAAGELIVKAANDWAADIIVCGTHGRRGLRRIVLGSDAEYLVRHTPVALLLVRAVGAKS